MATPSGIRPLVLIILDGWGVSLVREGNAIFAAPTPNMDSFLRYYPAATLRASGIEVGLPWGEVGNSETGHRNIGAGQVQYQALPRIDKEISDETFFTNEALLRAITHAKEHNSNLHLIGLVSPGGVHSHMNHLFALLHLCANEAFKDRVYIHMFTDGRDTPSQSALGYLHELENAIGKYGVGKVASITGRFYAMDRNKNWERTQQTFSMLTGGPRKSGAPSAQRALEQAYAQNIFDEMIPPTAMTHGGEPIGTITDNDSVIFFNFRPDRARQLTEAFVSPEGTQGEFAALQNIYFCTMYQYDPTIPASFAYTDEISETPLSRVISNASLTQLHIAETEKYAHVTYYVNVGHEEPFPGEQHVLIPSSSIESFADDPHMQAGAITDRIIQEIEQGAFDFYVVNFANPDMVGHTGNFNATVEACAFVDFCIGRIYDAANKAGGALLITGDHGNAEELLNPSTKDPEKDHTSNPVPLYYVYTQLKRSTPKSDDEVLNILTAPIGVLADIAPTVLDILGIPKPEIMTGVSLVESLR